MGLILYCRVHLKCLSWERNHKKQHIIRHVSNLCLCPRPCQVRQAHLVMGSSVSLSVYLFVCLSVRNLVSLSYGEMIRVGRLGMIVLAVHDLLVHLNILDAATWPIYCQLWRKVTNKHACMLIHMYVLKSLRSPIFLKKYEHYIYTYIKDCK